MGKKEQKPAIRFQGFTDAWEQRKLSSIVDRVTRKNTNLKSMLPLTISAQYGLVDQVTYFNNRVASQNISNYYLVKNGEFAYNKSSSEGYPLGAVKRLDLYDMGVLSTLYIVFALKDQNLNSDFLACYYDTDNWYKQVSERAAEGARNHGLLNISAEDFLDTDLMIPPDIQEQVLIGDYLKNLDHLITLHQRKYEKIVNVKKSMLEKMFPRDGASVPEIRFAGFTDPWEQRKLGDIYTERSQRGDESLQILSVSIHSGVSDGELDADNLGKYVRRSEDKSTYKHVYPGDLVFNMMRAWQGAIGVAKSEGMISPAYISAIPNKDVYPLFMNYLLRRKVAINQINNLSYGVTDFRKRLYWNSFVRVTCKIPSFAEQQLLAEIFENLDDLITLHQRKLEMLKNIKKAMLEKMFV